MTLAGFLAAAAPAAAQEPEPSPEPPRVAVSGLVDIYYGYNFNKVDPVLRAFDVQHNALSLSFAEVALEKTVSPASRVGFRVDLDFGRTADIVASFEPSETGQEIFKNVQQAYLTLLAGKKLQLDVGKFVTPHGAEVIEPQANWNYTRSMLFTLAIPFYHVGVRATLPVNDKVSLSGYAVNGWNNSSDNNEGKTFALGATVKPSGSLTWVNTLMAGPEQTGQSDTRFLFDTTATLTASPKLSLMANFDYGTDTIAGAGVRWWGIAAYTRLQATRTWAVIPRFEYLDDTDAFMTGTSQTLQEITLTSEHKVAGDLLVRLEYRTDFSDQPFFPTSGGTAKKSQSTFAVGLVYAFGGKI